MKACFNLIWRELHSPGVGAQRAIFTNSVLAAILWLGVAAMGVRAGSLPSRLLFGLYLAGGLGAGIVGGMAAARALEKERDQQVLDSLVLSDLGPAGTLLLKAT